MDTFETTKNNSYTHSTSSSQDIKPVNLNEAEDRKVVDSSLASLRWKYWLGLSLHIIIFLVHLALIAVLYAGHLENRISVPLGRPANIASVVIVVATQVVNQVFLVGLVLIVQQLALRRTLHKRQTLTAVHDQYNAWTGFGAAFTTLLKQYYLPASVWSIVAVTAYLLAVSVLHITVPATFSLATFNKSLPGTARLKNNRPSISEVGVNVGLDNAASLLPMMGTLSNTNTTVGLLGNMIFSSVSTSTESVWPNRDLPIYSDFEVPATTFHVDCGLVDNGVVRQNGNGTERVWNITSSIMGQHPDYPNIIGSNAPIQWLAPYMIRFLPLNLEDSTQSSAVGQTALFYASVNITDDRGRNGTQLDLDPPMKLRDYEIILDLSFSSWKPTVFACNMHTETRNVTLDAHSGNISRSEDLTRTVRTTWEQWQQPEISNDILSLWGSIFNIHSLSTLPATLCHLPWLWTPSNLTCQYNEYLTIAEKFLNDRLNIRLSTQYAYARNTSVALADLELALEDMTAAIYWSAANYVADSKNLDGSNFFSGSETINVAVQVFNPAAQLNVCCQHLLVGFLASLTLLIIFLLIIRTPEDHATLHAEMTMTGLLQLVWLLGRGSSAQDMVAEVDFPTTDNLRKAAKFEVCIETLVRRDHPSLRSRMGSNESDEDLELTAMGHDRNNGYRDDTSCRLHS
ncbi:hypothetical protein BDY19DRAFT_882262 [Irpex rosettiformis]|uniref:Uncharacterized protein n=1 Tax=Irpex rosettiformis TaxID=378272 RepID=A0ACB8UFB9_9APHY|nr:hypothetical protein BDY19DRAFT_882262 [Irpex rosettiformis]